MLRKALNDAVRWGLVRRNVVPLADPPPARAERAARRRSRQTWSPEELKRFLAATSEHELHAAWFMAATTGLRRSELLGLHWRTVDLRRAVITVRATVVPVDDDGYGLEDNQKSTTSARTIHLDQRTVRVLRRLRDDQQRIRGEIGRQWNDRELVFPAPDGTVRNPQGVSDVFDRADARRGCGVSRRARRSASSATLSATVHIGCLLTRRWQLLSSHRKLVCWVHGQIAQLIPGGA